MDSIKALNAGLACESRESNCRKKYIFSLKIQVGFNFSLCHSEGFQIDYSLFLNIWKSQEKFAFKWYNYSMANFKTHISWGVVIAIGFILFALIYSILSETELLFWIFLAVLVGSFLPDLDLDEGVPFQILFGLLGLGSAGIVFLNAFQAGERELKGLILPSVITFLSVRFLAGYIFERFTNHRGMFHSIPAAFLSGLVMIWILELFSFGRQDRIFMGLAVSLGYLGHLVLDEIYSSANIHGHSLLPKQSLGSALKLRSSSKIATAFVYVSIIILVMILPDMKRIFG